MRPVNLLPEEHRPRRASGSHPGSAYAIIGVLGVLLAMVTVYVLTSNQVSARQSEAAAAKRDVARSQAETAKLGPFGNFTDIKQTRVASVQALAQARFDWERFVRELALVLPRGTWLTEVDAVASGDATADAGTAGAGTAPTGPNAKVTGCARRQPEVAKLMVRMRKMHRVKDVELKESTNETVEGGAVSGASPPPAAPAGGAPAGGSECTGRYKFDVVVQFEDAGLPTSTAGAKRVPGSLGGGG